MVRIALLVSALFFVSACTKESSNDKNIYKKYNDPIITDNDFFVGSQWNDPHVLKDNDQLVMYASADRGSAENIKIYRLISEDGENWQLNPDSAILKQNTNPDAWDRKSIETPAVVFFNNKYHLFYTAYPQTQYDISSYKIGHATSTDGINFVRDETYLLAPTGASSTGGEFHQYIVAEPAPLVYNDELYLYFTASGYREEFQNTIQVIGLITSPDGENWTVPEMVLEPEQGIYPRSLYAGYSSPSATIIENQVHLFFDVIVEPYQQINIHRAVSDDGKTNWVHDKEALIHKDDFSWTSLEINGSSALMYNEKLYLWFAGNNNKNLGIGLVIFNLE